LGKIQTSTGAPIKNLTLHQVCETLRGIIEHLRQKAPRWGFCRLSIRLGNPAGAFCFQQEEKHERFTE
jgi:hypothetical protein